MDLGMWTEPDTETVDRLTRLGCFAADSAVINLSASVTDANRTKTAVRAALRMLLANGAISVVEPGPDYVQIDKF